MVDTQRLAATSLPLRSLFLGRPPERDRILFHNVWFRRGHNNVRYEALLPRLQRVDALLAMCSGGRIRRGIEFRVHCKTERLRYKAVFAAANRRYKFALCTDFNQIPRFAGRVVVDVDDPAFGEWEARLLALPNVAAYVVTAERTALRYQSMGLDKPHHVIPQGVQLDLLDDDAVRAVASEQRRSGDFVIGFVAAFLFSAGDRGSDNPLYNIDHLLDLWDEIRQQVPHTRLWLVGEPGSHVSERCARRSDILLTGRLSPAKVLAHVANFDVALYPRTADQGIQSVKVAEYMSLGIPTVSYDYEVTRILRETGGGLLVDSPRDFVDAVVSLAGDSAARRELADAAALAGREYDWNLLAEKYEREILDVHLR